MIAFADIKELMDMPIVRQMLADCVFDSSPEVMAFEIGKYRANDDMLFKGYFVDGELVGICGFEEHKNRVEILHISVLKTKQHKGIGRAMVSVLHKRYGKVIETETKDETVEFYRKCGFETTAMQKYNVRRWVCVLAAPDPLNKANLKENTNRIHFDGESNVADRYRVRDHKASNGGQYFGKTDPN